MLSETQQKSLRESIKLLNLKLTENQFLQIGSYIEELMKWNKVYNLTGFRTFEENLVNNILDCLSVSRLISGNKLIDVGTGAGLPGMLLAIVNPEQHWTLLDANGKKTRFLQHIKSKLQLNNVEIVNTRVENYQAIECYDSLCSRAFDKIPDTLGKCQNIMKTRSSFFALKGKLLDDDLQELPGWASVQSINEIKVPRLDGERHLIHLVINKATEE